jgi:hypothetical protein
MGEEKLVERPLMSEDEFKEYIKTHKVDVVDDFFNKGILHLNRHDGINKFRSVRRAIKRGLMTPSGAIYPKKPFNNRANTSERKGKHSRAFNELKKDIYARYKQRTQQ